MRIISVKGKRTLRLYETEKSVLTRAAAISKEVADIGPSGMKDVATKAATFTNALVELFNQEERKETTEEKKEGANA